MHPTIDQYQGFKVFRRATPCRICPAFLIVIAVHELFIPHAATVLIGVPDGVPLVEGRFALYREGLLFGMMVIFRLLTQLVVLPWW